MGLELRVLAGIWAGIHLNEGEVDGVNKLDLRLSRMSLRNLTEMIWKQQQ